MKLSTILCCFGLLFGSLKVHAAAAYYEDNDRRHTKKQRVLDGSSSQLDLAYKDDTDSDDDSQIQRDIQHRAEVKRHDRFAIMLHLTSTKVLRMFIRDCARHTFSDPKYANIQSRLTGYLKLHKYIKRDLNEKEISHALHLMNFTEYMVLGCAIAQVRKIARLSGGTMEARINQKLYFYTIRENLALFKLLLRNCPPEHRTKFSQWLKYWSNMRTTQGQWIPGSKKDQKELLSELSSFEDLLLDLWAKRTKDLEEIILAAGANAKINEEDAATFLRAGQKALYQHPLMGLFSSRLMKAWRM